jgi:lipopolysaccharide transport system ATP-binding protein
MSIVIEVSGISKEYHRTQLQHYGDGLRHLMDRFLRSPWQFFRRPEHEEAFWALKDVSFEVQQGEVLGLIGRNGAGKSTLLKILSRITRPTVGHATIRGRVGSLLEVGTGFHPELTGRENVFLNGAILGMSKREIARKFDEIVAFAELEKFIDTPVKHYSSGMHVRLAFAVAAHLEPEILLVDEVLAVGDAAFQKKCLGKMGDVARRGRTIIFVSHNTTAMRSLCGRGYFLEQGRVAHGGPIGECIDRYLETTNLETGADVVTRDFPRPEVVARDTSLRITRVRLQTPGNRALVHTGKSLDLEMEFEVTETVRSVVFGMGAHTRDNLRLFECRSVDCYGPIPVLTPGKYSVYCTLQKNPLNPGWYTLLVGARCEKGGLDYLPDVMSLQVELAEKLESIWLQDRSGLIRQDSDWSRPRLLAGHTRESDQVDELVVEKPALPPATADDDLKPGSVAEQREAGCIEMEDP